MTDRNDGTIERIVLVGLSGSGKSTIARLLADRLGWEMADSDDWIVAATGHTIPDIFAGDGEARFRQIEHEAIAALCARPRLVLATGGGVVTVEANWSHLQHRGLVVWLQARPETILARLRAQAGEDTPIIRPLLAGDDPTARLRAMIAARTPLYARADLTIATDDRPPAEVVAAILAALPAHTRSAALAGE
jgi:shikimate kinase